MQNLENHIENLLKKHDFVVIPGFGGFVVSEDPAKYKDGYLYPPTRTIGYNPELTYNDGLLAQEIAKTNSISISQANQLIAEKADKLNNSIKTFKHLSFGTLGVFHYKEDKIYFDPAPSNKLLKSSYGLQTFYFPEIKNNTISLTEKIEEKKETAKRYSFNYVAACAAVILLLLLIPANINKKQIVYRAALIPITPLEEVVIKPQIEEEVVCTPYHAVIGSFNSQKKALKFLEELPEELSHCKIVYSDQRFRIIADSYQTEDLGNIGIEEIAKKFPQFRDVWLLEYNP